ncbi:alpha/beta hydrolase [Catenuloplanes japonicus]|uniref:alpha/beta hydrolase n=1 Tax=Catenuloplanes japonicus TaxID=33876 RepID=UPI000524B175|nr:alpha/beta fold hydrolase [Catenuloplanes japonicus]
MTPVVFIHGLWLHAGSWQPWAGRFAGRGYAPMLPGWPGEPATVEAARRDPGAVAGLGLADLTGHHETLVRALPESPVLIGHALGGLIAQRLLGSGLGRAAVAIAPAPARMPAAQLAAAWPVLRNPANRHRAVSLTAARFRHGFGSTLGRAEADDLFGRWAIPSPGRPVFETACAHLVRGAATPADAGNDARGPLLLISGQEDRLVPDAATRAAYKRYGDSSAITELKQYPGRGHSLTIDGGWRQVADHVLEWLDRHDR